MLKNAFFPQTPNVVFSVPSAKPVLAATLLETQTPSDNLKTLEYHCVSYVPWIQDYAFNCCFLSLQMFFQVWPLGSAHEATYLRPGEKGEIEREKEMKTKSEKSSAPPKNSRRTLGAREGVWPQTSRRGRARAKVVGYTPSKPFISD